jgi:muramoyltetrapeptide carboxypeptidase
LNPADPGPHDAGLTILGIKVSGLELVTATGPLFASTAEQQSSAPMRAFGAKKTAAFNMTVLCQLLGTPLQPDLDGHVLMLEEVGKAMYRIDRSLFHITSNVAIRKVSGIMLGRCSGITPNEPDFGMNEEEIARYWCRRSGIPWLGRADIGHDTNNKIVPFGSCLRTG